MKKIVDRNEKILRKLTHEQYLKLVTDYSAMKMNGIERKYTGEQLATKYKISRTTIYKYLHKFQQ